MRRALLTLLCAGAGALAGCGSDAPASDAEQIQKVFDYYLLATQQHNADLLCTSVVERTPGEPLESCINFFTEQMRDPTSDLFTPDRFEILQPPRVDGDKATVRVSNDGDRFDVTLRRGSNGWRMAIGS